MEDSNHKIAPLKKVTLGIETGRTRDRMDLTPAPIPFEFIFGVGVEGLTPFEKALDGKTRGMAVFFQIRSRESAEMFGHLRPPIDDFVHRAPVFYLKATIDRMAAAGDREVVSAMARATACGEGDCGCGCKG